MSYMYYTHKIRPIVRIIYNCFKWIDADSLLTLSGPSQAPIRPRLNGTAHTSLKKSKQSLDTTDYKFGRSAWVFVLLSVSACSNLNAWMNELANFYELASQRCGRNVSNTLHFPSKEATAITTLHEGWYTYIWIDSQYKTPLDPESK